MPAALPPDTHRAPLLVAPPWARALDVVCLCLLVLAVIIAEWGGFRVRVAGIRLAMTSAPRVLVIAVLLTGVRHFFVPRPSLLASLGASFSRAWHAPDVRLALRVLSVTRPVMFFIGFFAVVTLGYNNERPPERFAENEVLNLQAKWDAGWYMSIAVDGYRYDPNGPRAQQNLVFFPALPMTMRIVGRLFGGSSPAYLWGGTLVVLAAFLWALVYIHRLARDWLGDDDAAEWAVWVTAAYPFAAFFGALYTESFFLLGAAGAIYHFRRHEFVKAGIWGLLVGLTRPNGCFLAIPLALIALGPWLPSWLVGGPLHARDGSADRATPRALMPALVSAAMPGVGVLLFSAFMWQLTGRPLIWAELHLAWGREYTGLLALLARYYGYFEEAGVYTVTRVLPFEMLNALGAAFVIATAYPVWRRFGLPYAVFILVNIITPLAAGGFLSAGRFSAVLFPAFIWFAGIVPVQQRSGWIGGFMAVQALVATLFYTWHEMF